MNNFNICKMYICYWFDGILFSQMMARSDKGSAHILGFLVAGRFNAAIEILYQAGHQSKVTLF